MSEMSSSATSGRKYTLRAHPTIKRYNVARFEGVGGKAPLFSEWPSPVVMYREQEKVYSEDEENERLRKEQQEANGYSFTQRRKNQQQQQRRKRRKNTKTRGWVIEGGQGSSSKQHTYNGTVEGGQSATYMLFAKTGDDEFSVIPVEEWFRFKKPLTYQTLTLEEAEEKNNEKKHAVERWIMKHKLAGDDTTSSDVVTAPRVRTGAVSTRIVNKDESNDAFSIKTTKAKGFRRKVKIEEDANGDDGGDFAEKFDDDESDPEISHAPPEMLQSDSDEDDYEQANEDGSKSLNETGQAMKDLLKRAQSGEMDTKAPKKSNDDDSSDDEFSHTDMNKYKRDLGGNIIRDSNNEEESARTEDDNGDKSTSGKVEAKAATEKKTPSKSVSGSKRTHDKIDKGPNPSTLSEPSSSKKAKSSSSLALTEACVQQILIRFGGRMKTRDLLKKFRKLLVTDDDKALIRDILRTICTVETDKVEKGKLLVLKTQFQ